MLAGFTAVTVIAAATIVPLQRAHTGLPGVWACLWLFVTGCGGCFPTAAAIALANQGSQSGTATSLYGFATFAAAGLISPLPGLAGITNPTPLTLVLLATSTTSLAGVAPHPANHPNPPHPKKPGDHVAATTPTQPAATGSAAVPHASGSALVALWRSHVGRRG